MADEKTVEVEEPKKLVRFRANVTSPTIEIGEGEYRRLFKAEEQPFEVENDEELQMLRATGLFVEDKEAEREARDQAEGADSKSEPGVVTTGSSLADTEEAKASPTNALRGAGARARRPPEA